MCGVDFIRLTRNQLYENETDFQDTIRSSK